MTEATIEERRARWARTQSWNQLMKQIYKLYLHLYIYRSMFMSISTVITMENTKYRMRGW